MFRHKSKTEQLSVQSATLADAAAIMADQLRGRVVPVVGQAAESAKEWGQPRVMAAKGWAKPHVEHGIEVAAPRLESAVSSIAPKVDVARDKIVDDLIPKVTEAITAWAAASAAAKDEAVSRGHGAAAVISGAAVASPKHKRRGPILMALGLLAATAAAVMAFMRNSAPRDDPWATPLADPDIATSNGRHPVAPVEVVPETLVPAVAKSGTSDSLDGDPLSPLDLTADADLADEDRSDKGPDA